MFHLMRTAGWYSLLLMTTALLSMRGVSSWAPPSAPNGLSGKSARAGARKAVAIEAIGDDRNLFKKTSDNIYELITNGAETLVGSINPEVEYPMMSDAVSTIDISMKELDDIVAESKESKLAMGEFWILASACVVSFACPFFLGGALVEPLVPAMAAITAGICLVSEYKGKTAVCNARQISAEAVKAAAEGEVVLSQAERSKCIITVSLGVSAATAFILPIYFNEISQVADLEFSTGLFIGIPAFAVLSAAVAGLANKEVIGSCTKCANVGRRRFASSKTVTRKWLSVTELVDESTAERTNGWVDFVRGVLAGPAIGALAPGALKVKALVAAVVGAAQTAYYFSTTEYALGQAMDNVFFKTRCAAIAETYANQGARSGAILTFTSALGGFMAAVSAGVVLVFHHFKSVKIQALICLLPTLFGAILAGAASVSRSRCEVDSEATSQAIEFRVQFEKGENLNIAESFGKKESDDGTMNPIARVVENIRAARPNTAFFQKKEE